MSIECMSCLCSTSVSLDFEYGTWDNDRLSLGHLLETIIFTRCRNVALVDLRLDYLCPLYFCINILSHYFIFGSRIIGDCWRTEIFGSLAVRGDLLPIWADLSWIGFNWSLVLLSVGPLALNHLVVVAFINLTA